MAGDVPEAEQPSRLERRKAQTRSALVGAAQTLISEGRTSVSVLEITQLADVGIGSFYNHFETKEELFEAAAVAALEALADVIEQVVEGIEDPAVVFTHTFRMTGRLHRAAPQLSRVILAGGLHYVGSEHGLWPRARRDIAAGVEAGRFKVTDIDLTMCIVAGAALCLGQLLHDQPDRDDAIAADAVAEELLLALGLTPRQAHKIVTMPLPELALG